MKRYVVTKDHYVALIVDACNEEQAKAHALKYIRKNYNTLAMRCDIRRDNLHAKLMKTPSEKGIEEIIVRNYY